MQIPKLIMQPAEENVRCLDRFFVLLLRVDHHGNLLRQPFLQDSQVRGCVVFGDQVVDGLFIEQREDLDVALGVLVAGVEPELRRWPSSPFRVT